MSGLSFVRLQALLAAHHPIRRYIIAYSGGVDSHVLLHLLAAQRSALDGKTVTAVYVDHALQPASGEWGIHCQRVCRDLGVDFRLLEVDARPQSGESREAAARRVRYQALAGLVGVDAALLTAHHQDDQAETLLLQLLRGAGPHGLAAMPACAPFGQGWLLRPLLQTGRDEILAYAERHGLAWVEDSSNADRDLDRNYLRHAVLPLLKQRWPAVSRTLARSARLCAEAAALANAQADAELARASGGCRDGLNISALRALDPPRQRQLLRRWLQCLNLPAPTAVQLHHILIDAVAAAGDRSPCIRWPGAEVRRYRDRLFAMAPPPAHDPAQVWPWEAGGGAPLAIPGIGCLRLRAVQGQGLSGKMLRGRALTIRFRRGGERLRPQGRRHGQALKKLLQEAGVPPWERGRIPLLYAGEQLAAVAGLWVAAELATQPQQRGWVLEWQKPAPSAIL